jgi:hypothetical protein
MVLDVAPRSSITLNRFKELFEIRVNSKAPKCLWIINSDPEPILEIPIRPSDDSSNLEQKEYLQSKQNYNNKLEKYKDEKIIFVGELKKVISDEIREYITVKDKEALTSFDAEEVFKLIVEAYHSDNQSSSEARKIQGEIYFNTCHHDPKESVATFAHRLRTFNKECFDNFGVPLKSEASLAVHFISRLSAKYQSLKVLCSNEESKKALLPVERQAISELGYPKSLSDAIRMANQWQDPFNTPDKGNLDQNPISLIYHHINTRCRGAD